MSKETKVDVTLSIPWGSLWLFTIAFAHVAGWRAVAAILIWPYYLGEAVASAVGR